MNIRTVWHRRALVGWLAVCIVLVPTASAAVAYIISRYTLLPLWAYAIGGIIVGVVATTAYSRRYRLYHFE